MKRLASLALLGLTLAAAPLSAQGPMAGPGGPGGPGGRLGGGGRPGGGAASFLLASTGELGLSDQQVVRLAGIARRAHERREVMRADMPRPPAPGAERAQPSAEDAQRMRQRMEQMREQERTDLRDALAVLTPDQQARAWEMMARRGGPDGRRGGEMRGRRGPGGPDGPGMRGGRGREGRDEGRRPGTPPAPGADRPQD